MVTQGQTLSDSVGRGCGGHKEKSWPKAISPSRCARFGFFLAQRVAIHHRQLFTEGGHRFGGALLVIGHPLRGSSISEEFCRCAE